MVQESDSGTWKVEVTQKNLIPGINLVEKTGHVYLAMKIQLIMLGIQRQEEPVVSSVDSVM